MADYHLHHMDPKKRKRRAEQVKRAELERRVAEWRKHG